MSVTFIFSFLLVLCWLLMCNAAHEPGREPFQHCSASRLTWNATFNVAYPSVMAMIPFQVDNLSHSPTINYKCHGGDKAASQDKILTCPQSGFCAVNKHNIEAAMSVSPWPQHVGAIHRIMEAKNAKAKLKANVIVVGGSMTYGQETNCDCKCSSLQDARCPPQDKACVDAASCSWKSKLFVWLESTFSNVDFTFVNFARHGQNSRSAFYAWNDNFETIKMAVSGNDMVFLDHSVNDAQPHDRLSTSFELLVRLILNSYAKAAGGARPTIVTMEQFPYHHFRLGNDQLVYGDPNDPTDWAFGYRKVSQHYGLVLWSLREVYWTHFGPVGSNRTYVDPAPAAVQRYALSPFKAAHQSTHAPWYVHMFIADVLADSITHVMHSLKSHPDRFLVSQANATLPSPYYNLTGEGDALTRCDDTVPPMLHVTANATFAPRDLAAFETDPAVVGKAGWREYVDHHDTPGWIINDLSMASMRTLSFPFDMKNKKGLYVHIKATYLKSYEGVGAVEVWMCGAHLATVDALDKTDRISIPSTKIIHVLYMKFGSCKELSVRYVPFSGAKAIERAAHHQKFKLLSLHMCTSAPLAGY